jgi:hypothetical protein
MLMGVKPQRSDHCGVRVEFFLRYHLAETGIASDLTASYANTYERYQGIGMTSQM